MLGFKQRNESFLKKATEIHNDKYDYSKVNYINSQTKVIIGCPEHGDFFQRPNGHISGKGCPKCGSEIRANKTRLVNDDLIRKFVDVHKNRYSYDNISYKNNRTKILITCKLHGDFLQTPNNHLLGKGCPKCKATKTSLRCKYNTEEFIKKARSVHFDKYIYDNVDYINSQTKVTISCLEHGDFLQTPNNHLLGKGCPKCKATKTSLRCKYNTEEFIKKARSVHGDLYNYSKVNYSTARTKVTISCPKHGDFFQRPDGHISGKGCSACSSSKGEILIRNILLKHNIKYTQEYRIPLQGNLFRYDFYLPDCNLLIEFHGSQHYFPVEFFGGDDGFKKTKLRDRLKISLAKDLHYKLLIVPYMLLEKNTVETFESLLLEAINKKSKFYPKTSIPVKEKWHYPNFNSELT